MAKFPKPYFRKQRGTWAVQIDCRQIGLGPDKDEAFREYHRIMAAEAQQQPAQAQPEHPLVVTLIDDYLDWLKKRVEEGAKAERTYTWYFKYLKSFASFKCAAYRVRDLAIDELGPIHVYQWVDSHPNWTTGRRGAMTSVQRAFSWAAKAGLLKTLGGRSPLVALEKPQQAAASSSSPRRSTGRSSLR